MKAGSGSDQSCGAPQGFQAKRGRSPCEGPGPAEGQLRGTGEEGEPGGGVGRETRSLPCFTGVEENPRLD